MKVCFLCANWPPEAMGGTEQVVTELARELRGRAVEVVAISGSDVPHAGDDVVHEMHDRVPVHRVFKRPDEWDRQGFVRPRLLQVVRELLLRERPDVLHVHSMASLGTGMMQVARELGVPCAITFHDLWVTCARYFRLPIAGITCPTGSDRTPCIRCVGHDVGMDDATIAHALAERDRLIRADVAAAGLCITPSATAARFVRECLPYPGEIEVIPHGLLRAVPETHRAPPPRPGEPLRIGTFGGLVAEKGVVELLDAVRGLHCELHLTGRLYHQAMRERIEAQQRAGVRIVLRGTWTAADRHPARDLHLAVFPSKCQETYGLVVDEALAHGVPTVVSDAGALRERAGAGGVVVTPIAQLANVLHELVGSPERLAALRAAIPMSLPTIAISADRHLELYRRLR